MWGVACLVVVLRTLAAADDARTSLAVVRDGLSIDALVDGTADRNLERLRADLRDVERGARSPVLAPLRVLPGVDRQIQSARALSDAGIGGAEIGLEMLDELTVTLEGELPTGTERVAFVDRVSELLETGRRSLDDLDLGPDGPLLGSLRSARAKAEEGIGDLEEFLTRAERITHSVRSLLVDGDQLLLAANNAEMRSGSGMFLQIGTLGVVDGELTVGELFPAKDIVLAPGAVDAGTPTYDELWGFLQPTVEWRNLAASPRFDVTAELASRMWEHLGNPRPTGVIAVDPFALRALLRATGPVEVDGERIGADEVISFLLNEQYDVFAGVSTYEEYLEVQSGRRDLLGGLVSGAFERLSESSADPVQLLEALRDAVRGRHILAWSSDPDVQAGWAAAEMTGALEFDSIMVSLLNRGINKLDPFVEIEVDLSFDPADDVTVATMDVTVRNRTPEGEVPYVAGPAEGVENVDAYGDYAGILNLSLPGVARNARIDGVDVLEVARPDGPVLTLATKFGVDRGAERTFRVTFDLPSGMESIRIEPSARDEPVIWMIGDRFFDDGQHHRVDVGG